MRTVSIAACLPAWLSWLSWPRDSAYLDASVIELLVERGGGSGDDDARLAEMGPGALLEVSQVSQSVGWSHEGGASGGKKGAPRQRQRWLFVVAAAP